MAAGFSSRNSPEWFSSEDTPPEEALPTVFSLWSEVRGSALSVCSEKSPKKNPEKSTQHCSH